MIAEDLRDLGFNLELKTAEWNDYRINMQDGGVTRALYGWTGDNGGLAYFAYETNYLIDPSAAKFELAGSETGTPGPRTSHLLIVNFESLAMNS
ncbi:hypothetical protein [Fulvimarina sp. MAC3]|uniref:hypothetical protein n=1 Tax=Fulvimarina sp. MAC3 TaxID=3148887 RepID=UPI0031FCB2CD